MGRGREGGRGSDEALDASAQPRQSLGTGLLRDRPAEEHQLRRVGIDLEDPVAAGFQAFSQVDACGDHPGDDRAFGRPVEWDAACHDRPLGRPSLPGGDIRAAVGGVQTVQGAWQPEGAVEADRRPGPALAFLDHAVHRQPVQGDGAPIVVQDRDPGRLAARCRVDADHHHGRAVRRCRRSSPPRQPRRPRRRRRHTRGRAAM